MTVPVLHCRDQRRQQLIRSQEWYGIDYLEVEPNQRGLRVFFFGTPSRRELEGLRPEQVRVTGGRRVTGLKVQDLAVEGTHGGEDVAYLRVVVDRPGDFSPYTLTLAGLDPSSKLDPRYRQVTFSFKVGCPRAVDCLPAIQCPPPSQPEPELNYLAKDYASLRQLILDRLALIMPDWRERHVPDVGITLVEALAYVGDHLSYFQDAVATEAYLETARQRISVRRHVRLVDYAMHEGCNARAWLCVETDSPLEPFAKDVYFIAAEAAPSNPGAVVDAKTVADLPGAAYQVFEPLLADPLDRVAFEPRDFRDPQGLWEHLAARGDELAQSLQQRFQRTHPSLFRTGVGSAEWLEELRAALNELLLDDSLDSEQRFPQDQLSDEANGLRKQEPRGRDLMHLNRMLLEEAFPKFLADRRKLYLTPAHNTIHFYTWGDEECCLPAGTTTATLRDEWEEEPASAPSQQQGKPSQTPAPPLPPRRRKLKLHAGAVVFFEEVLGPVTGHPADADPGHRHAVLLTAVVPEQDPLTGQPILNITWAAEDALPFPLRLSAVLPKREEDQPTRCVLVTDMCVARGNVVLVDHGATLDPEDQGTVPPADFSVECEGEGRPADIRMEPGIFRPVLERQPLTFRQPLPGTPAASSRFAQDPRRAGPQITLRELASDGENTRTWTPRSDLLSSAGTDTHFVIEVDNDGRARVRCGDGDMGRRPAAGSHFWAQYRVGNGPPGNVGAESISRMVVRKTRLSGVALRVRNPLPARGGIAPEPLALVKALAPHTPRFDLRRAITAEDYARLAERHPLIQRAAATIRWTGSGFEAMVALDPRAAAGATEALRSAIEAELHQYRRIGHDLRVVWAEYVPLDIAMTVCVQPHSIKEHVGAALRDQFSNRVLPGGRLGVFHPDRLTFGEGIALSRLVAWAHEVEGVESVVITKLERLGDGPNQELENGFLPIGPGESARLDNDPNFPENGRLDLTMRGGR